MEMEIRHFFLQCYWSEDLYRTHKRYLVSREFSEQTIIVQAEHCGLIRVLNMAKAKVLSLGPPSYADPAFLAEFESKFDVHVCVNRFVQDLELYLYLLQVVKTSDRPVPSRPLRKPLRMLVLLTQRSF